jgi:hypothetical protein
MLDSTVHWLDQFGSLVFWTCAATLVLINAAAVAVVMLTRSRDLVNRWTGPVLAANLFLLGAGIGLPVAAFTAKFVVSTLAPSLSVEQRKDAGPRDAVPMSGVLPQP